MSKDLVIPIVDEGLGNTTYLVELGGGRALAVDPSRDLRGLRAAARRRGLTVAYAADTHLHADYLSGVRQLAATDGARVFASAAGRREFGHSGLSEADEVDLGGLTLRALATPGHTDEHLSYLLLDGATALGVFTGGSLIVGAAARTDLLGAARTEGLARAQYHSLRRLVSLPDATAVWPTHGAGSFCAAPPGAQRTSTIGAQKATNALLAAPDEDTFVALLLESLGSYPAYFDRLAETNRRGPALLPAEAVLAPLSAAQVRAVLAEDGWLVDVRPVVDFAAGHLPGSVSIPLREAFATWLGWIVPADRPVVMVRNPDQDRAEICWQAYKIGYEQLRGELAGGVDAWAADGGAVQTTRLVAAGTMDPAAVLDIRQRSEYLHGHLPGAAHLELGDLQTHADALPPRPTVVMCGHGERAMTAASLLARAGHPDVAVGLGGPGDWAEATGRALAAGS